MTLEKGQSKFRSLMEANTNTLVGLLLTFVFSPLFYWMVGMDYTIKQLGVVTLLFTILSVIRGYVIRRFFNKKEKQKDQFLANRIADLTLKNEKEIRESLKWETLASKWEGLYRTSRTHRVKQANIIRNLEEELDMCKHLHLAAISDLVEGADYHSGDENFPDHKSNIEDANNSQDNPG